MSLGVGIDLGAASVTVAAVRRKGGSLALEHYGHYPFEELVPSGEPTPARVASALAHQLNAGGFRPKSVILGVSGRDAIIRYSHLPPMPEWRMGLLMEFEIQDVAERTGEPLSADFRALPSDGAGNLVLVALAKDARVTEQVEAFESAGFEVSGAIPQPVAIGDCFRYLGDEPDSNITLVLDIGQASTEVAIIEEGQLIFARSVAQGGEIFTERLQKSLNIDRDEAEEVKLSGRTPEGDDADELLRAPRTMLANLVRASVDFARNQLKRSRLTVERVVVCGGGSRVSGLVEAIGDAVNCPAEAFDPLADLDRGRADHASREAADELGPEAATALGLAFSACLPGATRLDLLPLAVKERLEFRHRTLWLYVAGVLLAASLLVSFATVLWEYSGQNTRLKGLEGARKQITQRLGQHDERVAGNDTREADLRALAGRSRPGYHLASLLRTLGELTPPEISLDETTLVPGETPGAFQFELSGISDDAEGRGVSAMRELERSLEQSTLVAEAQVTPLGDEGTGKRFRLTVVPVGNPAAAEDESS